MQRGKLIITVVAIIVAVAAIIFGTIYFIHSLSYQSTDDAFIQGHIVSISSRVDGHVSKVYIKDNQHVNKGDLLAELDPNDYKASAALAEAALVAAQAAEEQADAQVGIAAVDAQQTAKDYNRYKQLLDANASVTQQQVDHADAAAKTASAQLDAANKQVLLAKAKVVEAKASYDKALLNLSYTKIHAPQTGKITNKEIEAGEYIKTGQPLVMVVPQEVWVIANFKETQLKNMKVGQPVQIKVDAFPQRKFKGRVESIQAGTGAVFSRLPPENATGNYVKVVQRVPVKIVFDEDPNQTGKLSPGMSVVPEVKVK